MRSLRTKLLLGVLGCVLASALPGYAQGGGRSGGGGPPGGGSPPGGGGLGVPRGDGPRGDAGVQPNMQPGTGGFGNNGGRGGIPPAVNGGRGVRLGIPEVGGTLQTGPAGRWWDDRHYASALGLRPDQKRRMDAIFNGNRGELTDKVQTLRQEEARLESATRDTKLSQESIFGQMDRVAQARDALEKVNARLMESLRKELDQDQASRMQTLK